jgi:hypothetical protein
MKRGLAVLYHIFAEPANQKNVVVDGIIARVAQAAQQLSASSPALPQMSIVLSLLVVWSTYDCANSTGVHAVPA